MKKFRSVFVKVFLGIGILTLFVVINRHTSSQDLSSTDVANEKDMSVNNDKFPQRLEAEGMGIINAPQSKIRLQRAGKVSTPIGGNRPAVGTDQGEESEPNDTIPTADALSGTEGRIKGYAVPGTPDIDYYGPISLAVGDRLFATVMTSFSAGSVDSILELRDSADVLVEQDLNDGSFGATSSVLAGARVTSAGNYYLRVRENGTSTLRPYELYFAIKPAATPPTAEVESNNTTGTANALPASGWVSGTRDPASDADFFSMTLAAGDTVVIMTDLDPERDNLNNWNARTGFALFGTGNTQILVTDDATAASPTNPGGEQFIMTVKDAGTYYAYIDSATAATAGPLLTYNLNVLVIPAESNTGCTTYASTNVPVTIADLALSSSTITVPATTNRIRDLNIFIEGTHTFWSDIDFHLRSPNGGGNDNGFWTDAGAATVGGAQTSANFWVNDEAGIPPSFALQATFRVKPESAYRLDWFDGEDPSGVWTLDMRDDATGDTGTLTNWSLEICEDTPPAGNLIYNENFDGGGGTDGGFTHSGTADEWERGTPNSPATTVSPAQAAFLTCNSGTNCWKTDLDNTYNVSSSQDLVSPNLNLTQYAGTINLYWAMRYQMESATFDHAWVQVTNVNNVADTRRVWQWYGATMSEGVGNPTVQIGESAGWGRYSANISDFAGKVIQVTFHVDGDTTVNYQGMAVDDVQLYHVGAVAATVPVGGRVMNAGGYGIRNAEVSLTPVGGGETRTVWTSSFGYFNFDDVEVGRNYIIQVNSKRYSFDPQVIFVTEETEVNFTANP